MFEVRTDRTRNPEKVGKGKIKYPWREMTTNSSFFVPDGDVRKLASAAANASRNLLGVIGKKFSCETRTENGVKGVVVFCIFDPHDPNNPSAPEHNLPS
jgi:hypothetical protein